MDKFTDFMFQVIPLLLLLLSATFASAQTTVSGKIRDNKGSAVPGASVAIKSTYDGGTADSLGRFRFTTTEKGAAVVLVTSQGYKDFEQSVTLGAEPITLDVVLKEKLDELKAVTVTAGSFSAGDSKRATILSSIDVATTAGANADISAALKTLPGSQQIGEQEGLFVRGGAGYETKQFIDGTLVNNPYFTSVPDIATRGRFSPFLFKGTVFSTGGYSALYGQALSSAVLLESIDLPQRSEIDAFVSPLVGGGGTQQLTKDKKASYGINYSYANLKLYFGAVKQTPDYFGVPQFHSGDANFRIKTKNGGMIKYYTTFTYSELGLRRSDIDSAYLKDAFALINRNWYNNLSWRELLNNGWKMNLGLSYSTNKDDLSQQVQDASNTPKSFSNDAFWMTFKNFSLARRQDLSQAKLVFDKKLGGISALRFGSEYWHSVEKSMYNDTARKLEDHFSAVFAETDIYLTNDIAIKAGARFEYSSLLRRPDIAPRVSFAYKTGKNAQFSIAYGIFYQKPENTQLIYTTNVGFTKATHYIINYQKMTTDRIFRIEAYYKKYDELIKTTPVDYYSFQYNNNGSGYAKGIEFFWRDKRSIKDFDYWISYSYLDTRRDYLNYPERLTPNFAAKHTASLVTKRFVTKIKTGFNFTYSYATGRPYYNLQINNNFKYYVADRGITKDYHSLGFSVNYVPSIGKTNPRTFWVLFASVTNVLGYNAVYGYNYSYSGLMKEPILPPARRFYFIGLFLSWGVDRTQDAINNNL